MSLKGEVFFIYKFRDSWIFSLGPRLKAETGGKYRSSSVAVSSDSDLGDGSRKRGDYLPEGVWKLFVEELTSGLKDSGPWEWKWGGIEGDTWWGWDPLPTKSLLSQSCSFTLLCWAGTVTLLGTAWGHTAQMLPLRNPVPRADITNQSES